MTNFYEPSVFQKSWNQFKQKWAFGSKTRANKKGRNRVMAGKAIKWLDHNSHNKFYGTNSMIVN